MKIQSLLVLFLLSFSLTACSNFIAYSGEPSKAANAAIIKGVSPWFAVSPIGIVIKAVDGDQVNRFISRIRITPGEHQLDVVCHLEIDEQRFFTRHKLEVTVEAGKLYYLSSRQKGDVCEVFLE